MPGVEAVILQPQTLLKRNLPHQCKLLRRCFYCPSATNRVFQLVCNATDPGLIHSTEAALRVAGSNKNAFAANGRNDCAAGISRQEAGEFDPPCRATEGVLDTTCLSVAAPTLRTTLAKALLA